MKIIICGSMRLSREMLKIKNELENYGHEVVLPKHTEEYVKLENCDRIHNESAKNKINDLIRDYFREIKEGEAILVVNEKLKNINGYIGGNSFLEMGFAHILHKKIYLLNPIPEVGYKDEIMAMQPKVLDGDLSKI